MKNFKIIQCLIALLALSSCNLDPEYFSETAPSTFYDSPERVYQRLASPYIHVSYNEGMGFNGSPWALLQEFTTDEVSMPVRGGDWYDGGYYLRPQQHDFTPTTSGVTGAWQAVGSGVSKALDAKSDLEMFVNFEKMFPEDPQGTKENIFAQLDVLMAFCYLRGLDFFGGVTIYTSSDQRELRPRSTDEQVFKHIETLIKEALPKLPKKSDLKAVQNGYIDQGVAASILARLYFNAKPYIGKEMYNECAILCQDIIDGEYGKYELANSFQEIFGWGNETCGEIIWTVPSDNAFRKLDAGNYIHSLHYNSKETLGNKEMQAFNGHCLMPGVGSDGKSFYERKPTTAEEIANSGYITPGGTPGISIKATKLGSPFRKFADGDLRKQQYKYKGGGKYTGMFLYGLQEGCKGDREYKKEDISFVDQMAYMTKLGTAGFKEGIDYAEENSGVRLMKFSPVPTSEDKSLWYNPDRPIIRLSEIHYMLAECKYRNGDKFGAAGIINNIRNRYFEGADTDPVPTDFDEYRLLDEWMIEFIGENRRRTDLIRWDKFISEPWFAHEADGADKSYLNRFPISLEAMGANNLLEQNPGY